MGYRVIFSACAEHDLEQIVRFLAQKNPAAAERLGHALLDESFSLGHLPQRGVPVPKRAGCRRILHRPWFLIYYLVDEAREVVEVVRIWDARRNPVGFRLPK